MVIPLIAITATKGIQFTLGRRVDYNLDAGFPVLTLSPLLDGRLISCFDIFQFPFQLDPGTKEGNVEMRLD